MVGCTFNTKPAPCVQLNMQNWIFPSFPPFVLGPFSTGYQERESAWAPANQFPFASPSTIDVELYSLVLICSDLILSLVWHYVVSGIFNRPEFRIRFLSPSMRFTLGMSFGVLRLWTLSYIQPLPIHQYLSRFSFLVCLVLGLTALVFNDGPWRSIRSNSSHALNPASMLNPVHLTKVTKQTLARAAIKRSLESGAVISIVLDGEGSLLHCQRGALLLRHACLFRRASSANCIVQLIARREECLSGHRFFFGYWLGAPFSHFGVGKLLVEHKQFLLELLLWLNHLPAGELRWFQVPSAVAERLNNANEVDEDFDDDASIV